MDQVAGIGLDPKTIAVGTAGTFAAIEFGKRMLPKLFPAGTSAALSVLYPILAAVGTQQANVGPLAGNTPVEAGGFGLIVAILAGLFHDKFMKPVGDPALDKGISILKEIVPNAWKQEQK